MHKSPKLLRYTLAGLLLVLPGANKTLGWGAEGHQVVANIAERHLTDAARAKALAILGSDGSLVEVATWADEIRHMRPKTAPWHFIDIPLRESAIVPDRDCANGDCVTAAITHFIGVLQDNSSSPHDKNEALKFIVHFVGDLHQPLHCEDNNDRGGNQKKVTFFGKKSNLHSTWDTLIIQRINSDVESYADDLDGGIADSDMTQWQQGTVEDWALESHALAQNPAYRLVPRTTTPALSNTYFNSTEPVVNKQLQKAGIRLAHILNQVLQ